MLHVDSANVSAFAHDVLCGLKHEPLSVWQFLPEDPVRARRVSQGIGMPRMQAKQRGSDAAIFGDAQFELFRLARLPWPVDRDQLDDAYYRLPSHSGDRAFEASVFLDKAFHASHDVEFVDVHNNVSWLCGFRLGMTTEDFADMMHAESQDNEDCMSPLFHEDITDSGSLALKILSGQIWCRTSYYKC